MKKQIVLWGSAVCAFPLMAQLAAQTPADTHSFVKSTTIASAPALMTSENHIPDTLPGIGSTASNATKATTALKGTAATVVTAVRVTAKPSKPMEPAPTGTYNLTGKELLQSAGTFGDLPRFLQTLPGVIGGSDVQNASSVRGGNSFENSFVVDKVEVKNINHLALANSSGGLGSMLDPEFVSSVTFSDADQSSVISGGLSSLIEIRTTELPQKRIRSIDLGYTGAGYRLSQSIGVNKSLLLSARESVTNLFMNDVGMNGSPEFTNSFLRYTFDPSARDHFWVDSLSGRDDLKVRPTWNDAFETNAYNTDYSGWRNTTGLVWQHTLESDAVMSLVVSNSQSSQDLNQRDQVANDRTVFVQHNLDGVTGVKLTHLTANEEGSTREMGLDLHYNRINYQVAQPAGIYSPYSASTTPTESFSATPNFSTLDKAAFYELNQNYGKRANLKVGVRYETFGYQYTSILKAETTTTTSSQKSASAIAMDNAVCCCPEQASVPSYSAFMPHISLSVLPTSKLNLRLSWSRSAALPPYATLASVPDNAYLGLIHNQQVSVGSTLRMNNYITADVEVYHKTYTGYPVSTLFPQLSLATIMPAINEPFSVLTMSSDGQGLAQGVQVSVRQNNWHHFFTAANLSFASAQFTGKDGIYHSSANDLPVVLNMTGGVRFKGYTITARETAASGRPYTPILEAESYKQNREIYDLTRINSLRSEAYNRTDLSVNKEVMLSGKVLRIHAGAMNILNRHNFYQSLWRPRCPQCGPITEPNMGLQPDFGMSYTF